LLARSQGGDRGGRVIATGTPEEVALAEESFTGQYLLRVLPKERVEAARRAERETVKRNGATKRSAAAKSIAGAATNGRAKAPAAKKSAKAPVVSKNGRPKAKAAARAR